MKAYTTSSVEVRCPFRDSGSACAGEISWAGWGGRFKRSGGFALKCWDVGLDNYNNYSATGSRDYSKH